MKKVLNIIIILSGLILTSCGSNSENVSEESEVNGPKVDTTKLLADIKEIETKLSVDMPEKSDLQKASSLFESYARVFPNDKKAPDYLLKASDINKSLEKFEKSVELLTKIIEDYPNYERMESVYYNRASHTDFELRDTTLAKQYYQEFMEKYPNSDFVDDAQARIDQNFMSMEELIEMWTKIP